MEAGDYKPIKYSTELRKREKSVRFKIEEISKEIEKPNRIDDAFMKKWNELKELRNELATIESHLKLTNKSQAVRRFLGQFVDLPEIPKNYSH